MTRFCPMLLVLLFPLALHGEDQPRSPFQSKDGKFSVALPAKPVEQTNKVKTVLGELELHAFIVDQKDNAFVVMYSDYPAGSVAGNAEKVLDGCIEGNVKGVKGKLASEQKITIGKGKHIGREIVIEMPDNKSLYRARVFLVGDRVYQVVAAGARDFAKGKAVDEYLKSFKIDE